MYRHIENKKIYIYGMNVYTLKLYSLLIKKKIKIYGILLPFKLKYDKFFDVKIIDSHKFEFKTAF